MQWFSPKLIFKSAISNKLTKNCLKRCNSIYICKSDKPVELQHINKLVFSSSINLCKWGHTQTINFEDCKHLTTIRFSCSPLLSRHFCSHIHKYTIADFDQPINKYRKLSENTVILSWYYLQLMFRWWQYIHVKLKAH